MMLFGSGVSRMTGKEGQRRILSSYELRAELATREDGRRLALSSQER
jgi:hypothetical protein